MASNGAHCLATGLVDGERAAAMCRRLLADDMYSGWGIRTLSRNEQRYNPMSYHNGSVWPHDNAMAALGLARAPCQSNRISATASSSISSRCGAGGHTSRLCDRSDILRCRVRERIRRASSLSKSRRLARRAPGPRARIYERKNCILRAKLISDG
jgi:hypothetical protein